MAAASLAPVRDRARVMSLRCPKCRIRLHRAPGSKPVLYRCVSCTGGTTTFAAVTNYVDEEAAECFRKAAQDARVGDAACPECGHAMARVSVHLRKGSLHIDWCSRSTLLWFDLGELEACPVPTGSAKRDRIGQYAACTALGGGVGLAVALALLLPTL